MRTSASLVVSVCLSLLVGCDGDRGGDDAGTTTDSGVRLLDSGGGGTDGGPGVDSGGGTDAGGTIGSCGPTGACDVSDITSCGSGNACLLAGSSATMWETVCAVSGVLGQGEACSPAGAPCQEGFQCDVPMGADMGVCRGICCDNTDCAAGVLCQQIAGADGAGFCRPSDGCDIVDPNSCDDGEGCFPLGNEGDTQCSSEGEKTEGQECTALNECVAGYGCAGGGTCHKFCHPADAESGCPTDYNCAQLTQTGGTPIPGIGVCVPASTT